MGVTVDVTFKSLNKYSEILCGDTVECLKTEGSDVIILADGMAASRRIFFRRLRQRFWVRCF